MKSIRVLTSSLAVAALVIPSFATASHAVEDAYLQLRVSNQIAVPGQPIIISGTLEGCATFPTTFSLALTHDFDADPFTLISKSSSSFKYYKSGTTYFMNWIYRGPTGDGVEPGFVGAYVVAEGGCAVNLHSYGSSASWEAISGQSTIIPSKPGISSTPNMTSLNISWSTPNNVLSSDVYYQVQYSVSGTGRWSHSLNTRDTKMVLANLRPHTMYQVRVRAVNNAGASEWSESPTGYQSDLFATAGYSVKSVDSNGEVTPTFNSGETVTIKMHLTNCSFAPYPYNDPDPTRSGTITYTVFPIVNGYGDGYHAFSGLVDNPFSGPTGTYDSNEHTYDVSFPLSGLADGTYTLSTYFFGQGCSYDYTPSNIGYPDGETITFTVGQDIREIPQWSSLATITKMSPTSATVAWDPPANLKDGPFTYTVDIVDFFGESTRRVGTTQNTSMTISGLMSGQLYIARITVSNLVTTSQNAPYTNVPLQMPDLVQRGGSKITLSTLLKSLGLTQPTGGTSSIKLSTKKTAFKNCTVVKNVVSFSKVVGACSVAITLTNKKIGTRKPVSVTKYFDIPIR